jgi:hypothetical protein
VNIIAVVDIGNAGKAGGETFAYLSLAHHAPTPRIGSSGRVERGTLGEEFHDRVKVVAIERVEYLL